MSPTGNTTRKLTMLSVPALVAMAKDAAEMGTKSTAVPGGWVMPR